MADNSESELVHCLQFQDDSKIIAVIPFSKVHFVPRVGERVTLPGEGGVGGILYEVVAVGYRYAEVTEKAEQPGQAKLTKVSVKVQYVYRSNLATKSDRTLPVIPERR
ncbi:MAG: hypothetical protein ABSC02_03980 [Acidobacteriota bacterium]|jgi:hypothetical protein